MLLFTLRLEGEIPDSAVVEGSVTVGDTTLNVEFNSQGWYAAPDPLMDPHNPGVGMQTMAMGGSLNGNQRQANQWVTFVRGFAPGIFSGTQQISFIFTVDEHVQLALDKVQFIGFPEDTQ